MKTRTFVLAVCLSLLGFLPARAATGTSGSLSLTVNSNGTKAVNWPRPLIPGLETNELSAGTSVGSFTALNPALIVTTTNGYSLSFSNSLPSNTSSSSKPR